MGEKKYVIIIFVFLTLFTPFSANASDTITSAGVNEKNCTLEIQAELNVSVPPGSASNGFFNLSAFYPCNLDLNVTLTREGNITGWITFSSENSTNVTLSPAETRLMNVTVSVPFATSNGTYYANITAESGDGQIEKMNLAVNVTDTVGKIRLFVNDTVGTEVDSATVFVWLNSYLKDSGSTNSSGLWLSSWLVPGNYTVEAIKAGYITNSKDAIVYGEKNITNITITLEPSGAPILDISPASISTSAYTGDTITKLLTIMNIGDMPLDNINISGSGWMSFDTDFISSLSPSSFQNIEVRMSSSSVGTYYGNISVTSANDGNVTVPVTFQVTKKPEEPGGPGGGIGGGLLPPPAIAEPGIRISKYDRIVNISAGSKRTLSIIVENTGNVTLNNVFVSLEDVDFMTEFTPQILGQLEAGKKGIFVLELSVLETAKPGDYRALLIAVSDEVNDSKRITIHVYELGEEPVEEGILSEIGNLEELVDEIWRETVLVEIEGKNVSAVFEFLKQGKGSLAMARSQLKNQKFDEAGVSIDHAKEHIKSAVNEMAKLRGLPVECPLIDIKLLGVCYLWWFISISVLVIVSLIYLIKLRRIKPYRYTPKRSVKTDIKLIRDRLKRKNKKS